MILKETYQKKQFIFTYIVFICNGMLALSIGSLMPLIIGAIAGAYGIFVGMCSVGVVIAIDLVCIVALVRYVRKVEQSPSTSDYFCTPQGAKIIGWAGVDGIPCPLQSHDLHFDTGFAGKPVYGAGYKTE